MFRYLVSFKGFSLSSENAFFYYFSLLFIIIIVLLLYFSRGEHIATVHYHVECIILLMFVECAADEL